MSRMRKGSLAFVVLFVVVQACSSQDPNCPEAMPSHGAGCEHAATCTYPHPLCGEQLESTATCANGVWSVPALAACAPLSTPAACNPFGTWHIESDLSTETVGDKKYPGKFDLAIEKTAEGIPVVTGPASASVSADGCKFFASWTLYSVDYPEDSSWEDTLTQELEITFSADTGTGTLSRSCGGECVTGDESSPATAARVKP